MNIVLVTGGFDPIHSGHISYFNEAAKLGDFLIVGVNSDAWLTNKKGRSFMPLAERKTIVENIKSVDKVITFDDSDGSARDAIRAVMKENPDANIIFANGGDRTSTNIPEMDVEDPKGQLTFEFGVGGDNKMNSSSWILQEWKAPKTERQWGYYRVLFEDGPGLKVKELTVMPGKRLSMQRHEKRSEIWFVTEGVASVNTINKRTTDLEVRGNYQKHISAAIGKGEWHQLCNDKEELLKIVEIQYGENCVEEDIERK
jgi:D-beta-D-heptose 7-phosphate kinase/D-beta-D-heptose 1-phosphate adenosyltransferase